MAIFVDHIFLDSLSKNRSGAVPAVNCGMNSSLCVLEALERVRKGCMESSQPEKM